MSGAVRHEARAVVDLQAGRFSIMQVAESADLDPLMSWREASVARVVDTLDTVVRNALIALGWTPPPAQKASAPAEAECSDATRLRARANDPITSIMAAEKAKEFAGKHVDRILQALGDFELSTHQVATRSGLTVVQVDRRIIEMERERLIEILRQDGRPIERLGYRVVRRFRSP
jgi:hypothetical protein